MNTRGPRIDPWETPCFTVPLAEKKMFSYIRGFYVNFLSSVNQTGPKPIFRYPSNFV